MTVKETKETKETKGMARTFLLIATSLMSLKSLLVPFCPLSLFLSLIQQSLSNTR